MLRRGFLLIVLAGFLATSGCARHGEVIRTEAPVDPDAKPGGRVNNAESRAVRNWSGGDD